jgi:hypothetical protein
MKTWESGDIISLTLFLFSGLWSMVIFISLSLYPGERLPCTNTRTKAGLDVLKKGKISLFRW